MESQNRLILLLPECGSANVANLCNSGFLERVRHGYYRLAEIQEISEAQLISTLIPKGIVCVESALFHYGYSDFIPRKRSLAVPRSMSRTKLKVDKLSLQAYYVPPELYELGKTTDDFDGITLSVYNRERTICDCLNTVPDLIMKCPARRLMPMRMIRIKTCKIFPHMLKNLGFIKKLQN